MIGARQTTQLPWYVAAALVGIAGDRLAMRASEGPVQFNRDIRPILSDKCFPCHGQDASHRQANLRLDVESVAKKLAIVAGSPQKSKLIDRVRSKDPDAKMPPAETGKQLSASEIEMLERWIRQGAIYESHWAYTPPKLHATPGVRNSNWSDQWIDRFLLHRLESEGLVPTVDADAETLLRRLRLDLTGLPPAPAEVDAFVRACNAGDGKAGASVSQAVWDKAIDAAMSGPLADRYGERMASFWLDLVRYADTVGYHGDQDHNISPYRDWVIDAFADNMPFDRFTRDQLAGDLAKDAALDGVIASGYNRLLQTSHEGGVQAKEYLAIYAADRVRNLSAVWMGATMGCAACHDHKFDPYSMRDFYAMQAFFADLDEDSHLKKGSDSLPTVREPEIIVLSRRERQRLAELRKRRSEMPVGHERDKLDATIAEVERSARKTMVSKAKPPRPIRVLPRGNWLDDSGPVVDPATPAFLPPIAKDSPRLTRLELATWLTDAKGGIGGLTARVMVNRLWNLMFDGGLAPSLDDFGNQAPPPVHPELLDNLAVDLVEHGWDIKRTMKLMARTRAYRQSSTAESTTVERDPNNRLFGRQARRRLHAEALRDNALAIAGLLNLEFGGPSARPYQPEGYYRHLNFPKRTYVEHKDARQWRRGVYVHWQRQFLQPMLKAFDAPMREECTAKRPQSNTPLGALALLNDPTFVEAARGLAVRMLTEAGGSDTARLAYGIRLATARAPTDAEAKLLDSLLSAERKSFVADSGAARRLLAVGLAPVPKQLDAVELAAWTSVGRAILNMDDVVDRR